MRYLVTGGLGVIGSSFAEAQLSAGHRVTLVDDGTDARHLVNRAAQAQLVQARLGRTDEQAWFGDAAFDRVFHAAGSTGIPYSSEEPLDDWSRNVDGTVALLEALRHKPRPAVVLSSVKPYGLEGLRFEATSTRCELVGSGVDESFPLVPDEPYAASKAAQSLVCQAYAKSFGVPVVVFRCSNLYGAGAPHGPRHGWLTWFCIRAALGWDLEIQGSGRQTRDVLFSSDLAAAALAAFEALEAGRLRGEILNVGGGRDNTISLLEAVETLRGFGAQFGIQKGPGREHEDQLFCVDASRATQLLDWSPRVGVVEGMRRIYDWACEHQQRLSEVFASYRELPRR